MATLETNERHEPTVAVGLRRESGEIAVMVGARRREDLSRILCDTSHGPSAESARQSGDIAARSRSLAGTVGCGDTLEIMRDKIPNESADLVHLDPPFNSPWNYGPATAATACPEAPKCQARQRAATSYQPQTGGNLLRNCRRYHSPSPSPAIRCLSRKSRGKRAASARLILAS